MPVVEKDNAFGPSLNASDMMSGLTELNTDISFDPVINRPSDYSFMLQGGDNMTAERGGVFYMGNFVCAMDRGTIPEWAVWTAKEGLEPIAMSDIERYDGTKVIYLEILPKDPMYHHCLLKAQKEDDNYQLDQDGRVFRYDAVRIGTVKDKVVRVGWRHTLGSLVDKKIPNVTVDTLSDKLGVRL